MTEQIALFYDAFNKLDAENMVAQYHDDVIFEDPAFGVLHGERAKNMWRMLCDSQKGKAFKVNATGIKSSGDTANASWEAYYNFSKTRRKIHNTITAEFKFKDGRIISHKDSFNLHKWSSQAFGLKGFLLGWTPFFKKKLQAQTNKLLTTYEKNKGKR